MISNKIKLKECIKIEKNIYFENGKSYIISKFNKSEKGYIYRYLKLLRYDEYYTNTKKSKLWKILLLIIRRKKNIIGLKLGLTIPINTCDVGVTIYHANGIVINSHSKIGKYCKFHGDNCIGNDGIDIEKAPIIKDNVDIGVGAKIIGDIVVEENIIIGANAIVRKNFEEKNIIIAGVPAKKIRNI